MTKFLIIFIMLSCTAFRVEDPESGEEFLLKETKKINFCDNSNFQLLGTNAVAVREFATFLKKKHLSPYEKFALWALYQMQIRPESSSPFSKLQMVMIKGQEINYFEYDSKNLKATPFLDGLGHFLAQSKQKHDLDHLGKILDSEFSHIIPIGQELAQFLKSNRVEIEKNQDFKSFFFKANQLITEIETLPQINFSSLTNKNSKLTTYNSKLHSQFAHNVQLNCNEDILNRKEFIGTNGTSNHFGLMDDGITFLATSSLTPDINQAVKGTFLFKAKNRDYHPIICSIKKENFHLVLISDKGKGPGQHIYHLLQDGIQSQSTFEQLDLELNQFRFILLKNPKRIILESRKTKDQDFEKLFSLKIPIYTVPTLGNIWGHIDIPAKQSFLKDSRNESYLFCELEKKK